MIEGVEVSGLLIDIRIKRSRIRDPKWCDRHADRDG